MSLLFASDSIFCLQLLEGLQSSFIISKIPLLSHGKGAKTQRRSTSSSRGRLLCLKFLFIFSPFIVMFDADCSVQHRQYLLLRVRDWWWFLKKLIGLAGSFRKRKKDKIPLLSVVYMIVGQMINHFSHARMYYVIEVIYYFHLLQSILSSQTCPANNMMNLGMFYSYFCKVEEAFVSVVKHCLINADKS